MIAFIYTTVADTKDRDFMLWVYEEFKELMYSTAKKYVSLSFSKEDIVQESLVKLMQKTDTLRPMSRHTLASYIVSTIRNTGINQLKFQQTQNKYQTDLSEEILLDIPKQELTLDELLIMRENHIKLDKIWLLLTQDDRTLLEGKYILGYNDVELAEQLHCKPSSIRMKLTRARRNAMALLVKEKGTKYYDEA